MKPLMRGSLKKGRIRWRLQGMNHERFSALSSYEKYRRHILSVRNEVYRQKFLGIQDLTYHYDISRWDFSNEPEIPDRLFSYKIEHWRIYKDKHMEAMRRITNRPIGRYTPWGNLRQIYPTFEDAADWVLWYFQDHISNRQGTRQPKSKERIERRIRQSCLHWMEVTPDDQFAFDYFWEDEIYNMNNIPPVGCPYDFVWKYLTFEEAVTLNYGDLESLDYTGSRGRTCAKTKTQL